MLHGRLGELLAGAFGIAAAVLLVGGCIVLRFQRDRQHFRLMQTALERGITALPGVAPGWVMSLRQGVMALVLGLGILGAGKVLYSTAEAIPLPPADAMMPGPMNQTTPPGGPAMSMPARPMPRGPEGRDGRDWQGPPPGGPEREGPGRDGLGHDGPPEPPHQSPMMERWHQVQSQQMIGMVAMSVGAILVLLGLVRIVFSFVEKKYAVELPAPGSGKV